MEWSTEAEEIEALGRKIIAVGEAVETLSLVFHLISNERCPGEIRRLLEQENNTLVTVNL